MKAAILHEDGIYYEDTEEPPVSKGSVKIRVAYCGICGSDIPRVLEGKVHYYPIILGHEFSGIITAVGEGVSSCTIGDHVVGVPLIPCFDCKDCENGFYSLCSNYSFIGSRRNGAYAEYVIVPEKNVIPVPKKLDLKVAALIEPCTVARHAFNDICVNNRDVAIIGDGIIGLFAVQWAKLLGASKVYLVVHGNKIITPESLFADEVLRSECCDKKIADIVIDCAGNQESFITSLKISNNRASVVLLGTSKNEICLSPEEFTIIQRKELLIKGSWMSYSSPFPGKEWVESITAMNRGDIQIGDRCIGLIGDLENIKTIFKKIQNKEIQGRVLLQI